MMKKLHAKLLIDGGAHDVQCSVSHDGRIVAVTNPYGVDRLRLIGADEYDAYKDFPFILLEKKDADALVEILDECIQKLAPDATVDDDIKAFGEKAISYDERLTDRVDGLIYSIYQTNHNISSEKMKKEELA